MKQTAALPEPLAARPLEFDGARYVAASDHQLEWGRGLISELDLRGDEHILDLGCGDGRLTAQLADLVPRGLVIGLDASSSMLRQARQHARANLRFLRQDLNQIDLAPEFNVIFSNAALHWVKDHARLLARVFQGLRVGGRARFSFGGAGNCPTFNLTAQTVMELPRFRAQFAGFDWPWFFPSAEEYRRVAAEIPFRHADVWLEVADRFFPNAEALIRWVDQPCLVPFLARLDADQGVDYRQQVIGRMLRSSRQADGRCFEQFRRLHFHARK